MVHRGDLNCWVCCYVVLTTDWSCRGNVLYFKATLQGGERRERPGVSVGCKNSQQTIWQMKSSQMILHDAKMLNVVNMQHLIYLKSYSDVCSVCTSANVLFTGTQTKNPILAEWQVSHLNQAPERLHIDPYWETNKTHCNHIFLVSYSKHGDTDWLFVGNKQLHELEIQTARCERDQTGLIWATVVIYVGKNNVWWITFEFAMNVLYRWKLLCTSCTIFQSGSW